MLSMQHIRRALYRRGFRPKQGNIFHSPSLSVVYAMKDSGGLLKDQHLSIPREKTYFMVEMHVDHHIEGVKARQCITSLVNDESFVAEAAEWFPDVIYFEAEVIT